MSNIRPYLWAALAALLFLNYQAWMHDYPPADQAAAAGPSTTTATPASGAAPLAASVPQLEAASANQSPSASAASPTVPAPALANANTAAAAADSSSPSIRVTTDVLDLQINLKGGELDQADLVRYPLHKDQPQVPVRLLDHDSEATLYVLQTGLVGKGDDAPTHLATWTSPSTSYVLSPDAKELRVPLSWTDGHGLEVTKTFVFQRGDYAIGLDYDIRNDGSTPRQLATYSQILRHWEPAKRSYFDVETYSFKGPAVYNGKKAIDLKVEDAEDAKYSETVTNGWIAALQHHFVVAVVPTPDEAFSYQLSIIGKQFLLRATGPTQNLAPGTDTKIAEKLFIGPKLQSQLAATGPELQRTVDYGRLTVLSQPLFATLNWVHGLIGNWGWSIIIVTALIKLIFFPLSQASGRSMAKMRAVGPRMKQIQESFKDDREKLGRAMMDLYKKEKINPLAGCLPMVIQIPFFISFYWVLLESVEMRQAPFMLWINDLSARDPYFVLPLLMGGAMFAQFKLNPAAPDPMQAKIMQFMPLVMTGMMAWFPSGLVLYWLTNTVLSIGQQWYVNRVVENEAAKRRS
jgi:YidC/Oxa1 family membrane protein insertase